MLDFFVSACLCKQAPKAYKQTGNQLHYIKFYALRFRLDISALHLLEHVIVRFTATARCNRDTEKLITLLLGRKDFAFITSCLLPLNFP